MYFTPDGGKTWVDKGLHQAGQISAIAVDPQQPDTVFVCAAGDVWKPGPERGVFMSTDGGNHWQKVLYLNGHTGCSDIAFEPGNPKVLIAGMWPLQRRPWLLTSGGKSGGLYRSTDGGRHWTRLEHGLPKGDTGRSAIAFAPSQPETVYAVIQAKHGVLWVSHDLGGHWHEVSNDHDNDVRPFYFTQLAVMPDNPQRLFLLSMKLMESKDGGKTVFYADKGVHVDHHAIWIDPRNPERIIQGNDGGVFLSLDAGKHWRFLDNLPIEQFYQVAVSSQHAPYPYLICGGLQDNDAWCGAADDYRRGGVTGSQDWFAVAGGDGQYVVPTPGDARIIYATTDDGYATRTDLRTGRTHPINPYLRDVLAGLLLSGKPMSAQKYRFDWTTPIAVVPGHPDDLYLGANVVFHSTDGGRHWQVTSPDLTRNDKARQAPSGGPVTKDMSGAETYDTIQSLVLAPTDPHVLWVGTDDGWIWVSRDGGAHWTKVTPAGAPAWARVYHITVSPFSAGTAYAAFDAHELGDNHPYVFRTTDYGRHWTRITQGLPDAAVEIVAEDPDRTGLLFAGTLTGLDVSLDDGAHWSPLHANLPGGVSVMDLAFAPAQHALVLGTHGRGVWVLDNLRPVEGYSESVARAPLHAFAAAPGTLLVSSHTNGVGPGSFIAPNAPTGSVISYSLAHAVKPDAAQKARHQGPVTIEIHDAGGQLVDTLHGPGAQGINTVVWNLRYRGPERLDPPLGRAGPHGRESGPAVVPGDYSAEIVADDAHQAVALRVLPDPAATPADDAAYRAHTALGLELRSQMSALNRVLNHVAAMRHALAALLAREHTDSDWAGRNAALLAQAKTLDKELGDYQDTLWNPHTQHQVEEDFLRHFTRLHQHLGTLYGMASGISDRAPDPQAVQLAQQDRALVASLLAHYNGALMTQVTAWNHAAFAAGVATLPTGHPLSLSAAPALPR